MKASLSNEEFLERIGDRPITPLEEYKRSDTKMLVRCDDCLHEWTVLPSNLFKGGGCPACFLRTNGHHRRKTHDQFVEELSGRNIDVIGRYINNHTKVLLRCLVDGTEWASTPTTILRISSTGCPACRSLLMSQLKRKTNTLVEDCGDWFAVDISNAKHPNSIMLIDKDDWESVKNEGKVLLCTEYASQHVGRTTKRVHSKIMNTPKKMQVDHINHNKLDNRKRNLRIVTRSQNQMNKVLLDVNKHGHIGVSLRKGRWIARIAANGIDRVVAYCDTMEQAVEARLRAEEELFGEYSYHRSMQSK